MSEQVWYLYQNGQQIGPFDTQQVHQLMTNKMISQEGFIFKVGWKDWRPLEDGLEELGVAADSGAEAPPDPEAMERRRANSPRASVKGRVAVHNNGQLTVGSGVNISETGIFVETREELFTVGEQLKLSVRCNGLDKAFNAEAVVVRYNSDSRYPVGYGLQFVEIPDKAREDIHRLVEELNRAG
ncbi:PilZ domain-containing protein [Pseudobacteriovorax antillogorgiicola]|uniref:PilZ domain-containing protein n=1 Tax=Pseudobacteriovorax antillogorgiicola TaxID=1513793 RepID=A0A1Y6C006_9BACT|nr:PilZ domain-containing protein [Pseudobacteriovorax antillogorgiicola]TCS50336.1 uncharacterized protein DUF4339 [Pseudobacteriovorax antillogorgiicola]SMF34586.1 protein of unknown function [Pseudobacteriovorax antillogorgiicola]